MDSQGETALRWDFQNLEIRTKTIERTLEPLVNQVTTLASTGAGGVSNQKKGRSKRAHVLVAAVEKAIQNFLDRGMEIVEANPDARQELLGALESVRQTGDEMGVYSREFADNPCSSAKRADMIQAARNLLTAVTRLLIVADMVDVHVLMQALKMVEGDLEGIRSAMNQQDLNGHIDRLNHNLGLLNAESARRAADLKDPNQRDDLSAARAILKRSNAMLQSSSKAFIRHPESDPARNNRDWAFMEMQAGLDGMREVLQGRHPGEAGLAHGHIGDLAAALDDFDQRVYVDPSGYRDHEMRPSLEEQLERIISGAALIADSACTRDDRKHRIVSECNAVRQALQDLLNEYERNTGKREPSEELDVALLHLNDKTRDLRRHLRRAVVDHISDSFLDTSVPILMLIEAAKKGNQPEVEEYGALFMQHAEKLVEVSSLACQMCNHDEGVKMVQYAALQVKKLGPQVVNAARLLAARPQSKVAQENMDAFHRAWDERVRVLTLAVDSILCVDDFLAVSEAHILEDVNNCVQALMVKDADGVDRTAGAIRGRTLRVCQVVDADMDTYQPSTYTEQVHSAVLVVRNDVLPSFARRAEIAVDKLSKSPQEEVDHDDFVESAKCVYEGVRDVRHAVLMNREIDEIDSDEEYEYATAEKGNIPVPGTDDDNTHRNVMRELPAEERKKIQAQVQLFKMEKLRFDREVAKWDDAGNDIVVLAKHMCMIMMEMTDFTRGRGPLKNTMDVIGAAKKISEAGSKLNGLAKRIADESAESETKKDLLAYLQRITLYCHQLNITSRVKADVQQVGDELVVSGLESATSLIQAAKNLLGAVVLTVKAAYIASTKYKAKASGKASSMVVWKMRAPDKMPLIRKDKPQGIIRRASQRRDAAPIKILAQFQAGDNV